MEIRRKPWFVPAVKKSWEKCMENEGERLDSAMAVLGDFTFFAGKPDEVLIAYWPKESRETYRILVPQDAEWEGR